MEKMRSRSRQKQVALIQALDKVPCREQEEYQ